MGKIKVLHVGMSSNLGGIETYLINMYRNIDKNKFEFSYLAFKGEKICFYDELYNDEVKIFTVEHRRNNYLKFIKQTKKVLKNNKFDYIHFHLMEFSCFEIILLAKKYSNSKIILHSHIANDNKRSLKTNILNSIGEILVSKKDNYIKAACSKDAGKFMFNNFKYKEFVILNNAIDLGKFTYNEKIRSTLRQELGLEDKLVIGNVGRFVKQKNHIRLIDIFYDIYKQNKNAVLVLVGTGPLLDVTKQKVNELGIQNSVIFLGIRNDTNEIYQAMDVFLLPSLFEGLPFVLVEAQASGLPCFITDTLTDEVKVLDTTIPISLNKDNSFWSMKILDYLEQINNEERKNNSNEMYDSKFNIKKEIGLIENIYIDNINIIGCDR